jgi:DNA invertase Pin-like site-specific DNA recombinase
LEHSLISERTRAGVKASKRRVGKFGRKWERTPEQIDHARKLVETANALHQLTNC